ncbi:acyl carrier protein [Sedimentibacter sp. zth1]|uniref:acyl carrier protein n=1 Tax=Sedimentibacter sp. zth1 TaxID=2816908 RepID=UPI001A9355F3|nr:phosphopantetheine-binding protein [Sedimentibacter sp. zth1]QSX05661.1 acyl carrier protein [Sedimentibacter sp. zth1]
MEVKRKIRMFMKRFFRNEEFTDDDNIFENAVNSLFAMQLVLFIENEFDIEVDNDELDLENFSSVNAIVKYVESKVVDLKEESVI